MDEMKERKARDLRLKILKVEKELAASQHKTGLGAMLGAGHPSQMARAADRDRKRLEEKLEEYRGQLAQLEKEGPLTKLVNKVRPATKSTGAAAEKKTAAKKSAAGKGMKTEPKNPPRPEATT